MPAQLRIVSRMVCIVAAFSLMVLMSQTRAQAQSVNITNFSVTGSPGGYYNVTDTVNLSFIFSNIPANGGYGYGITTSVWYYSGPNLTGSLLQYVPSKLIYNNGGSLVPGNNTFSVSFNSNTPDILRASEPAGTQSFLYVYVVQLGGGCNGWSGSTSAGGPNFVVHG